MGRYRCRSLCSYRTRKRALCCRTRSTRCSPRPTICPSPTSCPRLLQPRCLRLCPCCTRCTRQGWMFQLEGRCCLNADIKDEALYFFILNRNLLKFGPNYSAEPKLSVIPYEKSSQRVRGQPNETAKWQIVTY